MRPIPPMKEDHTLGPAYPRPLSSTMSAMGSENAQKPTKKAVHRRNDSSELGVFEASRYFSSIPDTPSGATASLKAAREERIAWVGGRRSLDLSMQHNPYHTYSHRLEKHPKEKRSKQPSSPGAKLASFLNSLFSQASLRKKSKSSAQSMRDEEESHKDRRKRRSSISYFQTRSTKDSQSLPSSSSSGFRTPPPKVFRDVSLPRCNAQPRSVNVYPSYEAFDDKQDLGWGWLDQELRFNDGFGDKGRARTNEIPSKERSLRNDVREAENGWESDSSSDLFELKNYDLGLYSSGLPVYETTLVGPVK